MASAHVMKLTQLQAGQMRIHFDDELRRTHRHANPDIDNSKTEDNFLIGADSWSDVIASMKSRKEEVDSIHPPKRVSKDRVVAVMINIPCPEFVSNKEDFFISVYENLVRQFGKENCHGMTVHYDEVHDYIDKDGIQRASLVHGHAMISAYAEWTDKSGTQRFGINGKNFITKQMLHNLNNGINSMCLKKYGQEFFTGEEAEHKTVEELKQRSTLAQQVQKEALSVRQEIKPLEKKIEAYEKVQQQDIHAENITKGFIQKGAFIPGVSATEVEDALSIASMHEELKVMSENSIDRLEEAKLLHEEVTEMRQRDERTLWQKLTAKLKKELQELSVLRKFKDFICQRYPEIIDEYKHFETQQESNSYHQHR